jgi:hypothetical protein
VAIADAITQAETASHSEYQAALLHGDCSASAAK